MKAYTQEMQAKVVEAQAKVPTAMAEATGQRPLGRNGLLPPEQYSGRYADAPHDCEVSLEGEEKPEGGK